MGRAAEGRVMVRLISMTKGMCSELADQTAEDLISYTARVSNKENQGNFDTADKLIRYLAEHKHWSPFEMVDMTVEIETSRGIAAQILRHRSFCFQEFSQRYAKVNDRYMQYPARSQDPTNRQNSLPVEDNKLQEWFRGAQRHVFQTAYTAYQDALEKGVAKEQARFLLPLSTLTTMYMKGSIRSWIHYVDLRAGHGTQLEHQAIAHSIKSILTTHFPNVARAMKWEK